MSEEGHQYFIRAGGAICSARFESADHRLAESYYLTRRSTFGCPIFSLDLPKECWFDTAEQAKKACERHYRLLVLQ
jgi:hypothetical protein